MCRVKDQRRKGKEVEVIIFVGRGDPVTPLPKLFPFRLRQIYTLHTYRQEYYFEAVENFSQRLFTAFLAISLRRFFDNLRARALPPRLPSACAWIFMPISIPWAKAQIF